MRLESTHNGNIIISEIYSGVTIQTDGGPDYGICQRDGGIWIMRKGKVIARFDMNGDTLVKE